jgi:D-alanine-D-alanine ligase
VTSYAVLYNDDDNVRGGSAEDAIAAQDARDAAAGVAEAIRKFGNPELIAVSGRDPEPLIRALKACAPRAVFNLAEAVDGVPELESCVAGLLELMGLPYTGNMPQTLALCLDKWRAKAVLRGSGVPVPQGVLVRDAERDSLAGLEYPVIVKPAAMDASHGIDFANVVADEAAARAMAAELIARFPPAALVERFVDGREFNIGMLQTAAGAEPMLLPLAEVDWQLPPGVPRVMGFAAKWHPSSEVYKMTDIICPATASPELERRIREVCLAAFAAVGGRDYLRVDLRVDHDERPFVIEVNPNPCISPVAGFAAAAREIGWHYDEIIRTIVQNAETRGARAAAGNAG